MSRPRKRKRVRALPHRDVFVPLGQDPSGLEVVVMSVEEYETIRLIDHEGLTQEQSAERMNVGRGTVQRLYRDARRKLGCALTGGHVLQIQGGAYRLHGEERRGRGGHRGRGHRRGRWED